MTCAGKPAPQKTKIAQKLSAVGYKAVLPELIFVQARQSPQRILDVFARVLTRHELNPTGQNRHGFKSRQCPFSALFALFVLTCAGKPAPQKTKIAQKLSAVGYKAVLPELIFVQARQSPQRILDVFARVLTRHELNPTCQNRLGFKSRQPGKTNRKVISAFAVLHGIESISTGETRLNKRAEARHLFKSFNLNNN